MISLLKFLSAVVSLPFIWGVFRSFVATITHIQLNQPEQWFFVSGIAAYPVFQMLFPRPLRAYVFGHELTHVIAAIMMGGTVKKFKVSKKGGSVLLSKTNVLISLAPYCVPLYTVLCIALYYIVDIWIPLAPYQRIFLFIVGFTLSFHGALTLFALRQRQPDITSSGIFFSLCFIVVINMIMVIGVLKVLFVHHIHLKNFAILAYLYAQDAYIFVWDMLMRSWVWLHNNILSNSREGVVQV